MQLPAHNEIKIAIIGLGYVGLPLAVEFAKKYPVVGFDISEKRIEKLRAGTDDTREISAEELQAAENLTLTAAPDEIRDCSVYIVTVPTPIDEHKRPDLRPLIGASTTVGKVLQAGNVVIYESTVYPGCTEEDCVPILERESNLKCAFETSEAEGEQIETKEPKNQKTKKPKNQKTILRRLQPRTHQPRRPRTPPPNHKKSNLRLHPRGC